MSDVYKNTDGRADSLNRAATHDTSLYDPHRHDNQIVAVYDTIAQANLARDALIAVGVGRAEIQVIDHTNHEGEPDQGTAGGFWDAVKSLFAPPEDVTAYQHALGRGHAMLILTPNATMDRHRAIQILDSTHPIDFDAKLEEWRQAAYDQMPNAGAASGMSSTASPVQRESAMGPSRVRSYLRMRDEAARLQAERDARQRGPGGAVPPSGADLPSTE